MNRYPSLWVLIAGLALANSAQAQFATTASVLSSGAISAQNTSYRLDATLGQPLAGWSGGWPRVTSVKDGIAPWHKAHSFRAIKKKV